MYAEYQGGIEEDKDAIEELHRLVAKLEGNLDNLGR